MAFDAVRLDSAPVVVMHGLFPAHVRVGVVVAGHAEIVGHGGLHRIVDDYHKGDAEYYSPEDCEYIFVPLLSSYSILNPDNVSSLPNLVIMAMRKNLKEFP